MSWASGWAPQDDHWVQNQQKLSFLSQWISEDLCREELGPRAELLASSHFCAQDFYETSSVCHGDEGAGFVQIVDTVHYLTGVLSVFTNMCHPRFPGMFTRVAQYAEWIEEVVGDSLEGQWQL